ncbi:molybdopterin molybdotransferase MoeA [Desulfoferrobacter suflitae]|uniref:molybdopterin molybdotransferase MoeA n=1 Tax=Desulfoferrobacter suflitae TaxID=2865782 RepID=UPI00216484F0|nr:molybdopterin molybdotransferase MoeA [Desulfoferrobacter suflitae]MCK8603247.1 molybdopterin molybdotransferase MoeA [Desulfoferrobacter suflitae]
MELMEARELIRELASPEGIEWVWLDHALGRVLAEKRNANRNIPGEPRALVDGFAVVSSDTASARPDRPCRLTVRGELSAAGESGDHAISPGECMRILTGAPLPRGADAVIAQENALRADEQIVIDEPFSIGTGVKSAGSEVSKDGLLLDQGVLLTPTRLALLAALGYSTVPVFMRPRVGLLATGNEVKEMGESIEGPFTYCNNRYLLAWSTSLQGGRPIHLGTAKDHPDLIAGTLDHVDAAIVISTGGMGRGARDFVLAAWEKVGVTVLFEEVNLLPGHRSALGKRGKQIFMAFPGNPWGAQAAFEQLATVALHRCQGLQTYANPSVPAILEGSITKRAGFYRAVRGTLQQSSKTFSFRPESNKSQFSLSNVQENLSYILLESHISESLPGSEVQARFYDFPLLALPLFGVQRPREGNYA